MPKTVGFEFALIFFARTPHFQPINSRNSIRNVTCLHAFPAFTSRRSLRALYSFSAVKLLVALRGVDFTKASLGTSQVSRLYVHTSWCKRRKRRVGVCSCLSVNDINPFRSSLLVFLLWNAATMTEIAPTRFAQNDTYPRSDHSFKRRFKIVYSTLY